MHNDKMNCAKKTMLLTMAMSVPKPRICAPCEFVASTANYRQNVNFIENLVKKQKLKIEQKSQIYLHIPLNDNERPVDMAL